MEEERRNEYEAGSKKKGMSAGAKAVLIICLVLPGTGTYLHGDHYICHGKKYFFYIILTARTAAGFL